MRRAYALLARGELSQALAITEGSEEDHVRLLRLAAASDGAGTSLIERALDQPPEMGLDGDTLLPTLALAVRAGRALDPFKQISARILGSDAEPVLKVFSLLQTKADRATLDEAIRGLDPAQRGHIYVAACVLRRPACPPDWRSASRRLLFAPERPYLL